MPLWTPDFPHRKPRRYDPRVDPFRTEKELQEWLRSSSKKLGLLCYHTHISRHSPSGFPDMVIGRVDGVRNALVAELKMPWNPNPTDSQRAWLNMFLSSTNMMVCLWTSDELDQMRDALAWVSGTKRFPTARLSHK